MSDNTDNPREETQFRRRLKFGLNVGLAALLALALVVLLNWIAAQPKNIITIDRTATGQYSLAPQTLKVLNSLNDDYSIVTLFENGSEGTTQASDLVDEYGRRSKHIKIDHLDPVRDFGRIEEFYDTLRSRYAERLEPMQKAVDAGRAVPRTLQEQAKGQLALLEELSTDTGVPSGSLAKTITEVKQCIGRLDQVSAEMTKALDQLTSQRGKLPNYTAVRDQLRASIEVLDTGMYQPAITIFERASKTQGLPPQTRERLLSLVELLKGSRKTIADALPQLDAAAPIEDYDRLSQQLSGQPNAVVIIGPREVRVVYLTEMFRRPTAEEVKNGGTRELSFLGEERLTGSLISMGLKTPPLVVFIAGTRPAIGPGGEFESVAERLRKLNIEVQEWNPLGRPGPMGQMSPPSPAPKPRSGQKAVWIVQPVEPPSMMNPMGGGAERIAPMLQDRLTAGDSMLIMYRYSQGARMGELNPLAQLVAPWGVKPQQDRLILKEIVLPDRSRRPMPYHVIDQWPEDLSITKALTGMSGFFANPVPLELVLDKDKTKGYEQFPLVELKGNDLWAETDPQQDATRPKDAGTHFVIGVAVKSRGNRLVMIGDREWATDYVTTNADTQLRLPNLADQLGSAFPANAELFVNSTLWLAGLDDIIAASARTQDIRRIRPISEGADKALRIGLIAGMPLASLALGIGVWMVRRKA